MVLWVSITRYAYSADLDYLASVGAGICQIVVFLATSISFFGNRRKRTPLMTLMFKEGMISFLLVIGVSFYMCRVVQKK